MLGRCHAAWTAYPSWSLREEVRSRPIILAKLRQRTRQALTIREISTLPFPMGISTGNDNGLLPGTREYRFMRMGNPADVGYVTNNHVAAASGTTLCPAQLSPTNLPVFNLNQCQPGLLDARGTCV